MGERFTTYWGQGRYDWKMWVDMQVLRPLRSADELKSLVLMGYSIIHHTYYMDIIVKYSSGHIIPYREIFSRPCYAFSRDKVSNVNRNIL